MAQNRNNATEGKVEEEEERGQETSDQMEQLFVRERDKEKEIRERTSVQFQEHFVSVREKKSSKCESCVSEGWYNREAVFLCLVCEIYVCAGCMRKHRWHEGMEEVREESERDQREKMENKKLGVWEKIKKRVTKTFGKAANSEKRESDNERKIEQIERVRMLGNFVEQLFSESETERRKELKKKSRVSVCDRVNVKHELDRTDCDITGLCGLENRRWVACDFYNSCIKIFQLGSHVIQRYIRFLGAGPWDVTEIDLKQNSAEPTLVSGSSSGISGTDRADPDKPWFIAVTLPWKHQIMFIDVGKKPALRHKVLYTERQCWSIEFYDDKIFTVCRELRYDSPCYVYIKSTDGDTLHKFDTGIYGYFPVPYFDVVSGRVYLTDRRNHKVQCRNVEGEVITDKTIEWSGPVGISVDADNNVYVCALLHDKVYKLDANLTRYKSVFDQTPCYIGRPFALCYYRDKLFINHHGPLRNFVTVVRLS